MLVNFVYDEEMDISCLLTIGPGSTNSPGVQTNTYLELLSSVNDISDKEMVRQFIRKFIIDNNIDVSGSVNQIQKNWRSIESEFQTRAEKVFGVKLTGKITGYLTITGRFPYGTDYFYVSAKSPSRAVNIAAHEIWHLYTWKKFGISESVIGEERYNEIKESLSVILNPECGDLLTKNDEGYPQHTELRKQILDKWILTKNIETVWKCALEYTENTQIINK